METAPRPRVVIAVEPRLLGDALKAALEASPELDVVVHPDSDDPRIELEAGGYTIALVTGGLPDGIDVDAVVRIPEEAGTAGSGVVETGADRQAFHVVGVGDVVDAVARLLRPR